MSKCVKNQIDALPFQASKPLPFFVGQLVMRKPCTKDGHATGPFKVVSTYKLGRGTRYRLQEIEGVKGAGVTPGQIRSMTSEEEREFHKNTDYQHLELWI